MILAIFHFPLFIIRYFFHMHTILTLSFSIPCRAALFFITYEFVCLSPRRKPNTVYRTMDDDAFFMLRSIFSPVSDSRIQSS